MIQNSKIYYQTLWRKSERARYFLIDIIIFILFMVILLSHTSLLPDPSKLYSKSIAHRLQTDAFLHGHIALSPRPFGYLKDYCWVSGHGLQQNWGLGVPLLRLPFEWIWAQLGFGPFPDRLILLFYLTLIIILLNITLESVMKSLVPDLTRTIRLLLRWYFILWIFFSTSTGGLLQHGISVYYETSFYGCLYGYVLLCFLWVYFSSLDNKVYYILCFLSGLAWLIRPTLIFYGFSSVLIASVLIYSHKRNIYLSIIGWGYFCLGGAVELLCNYLRFGSILKFGEPMGYKRAFQYFTTFCLSSGNTDMGMFNNWNFIAAFKELLGDLFFNSSWQSHMYRNRFGLGGDFVSFNVTYLITFVLGLILFIFFLIKRPLINKNTGFVYFSLAWGLLSFGFLFKFYFQL